MEKNSFLKHFRLNFLILFTYIVFVIFNLILKGSCWISLSSSVIDAYLGDIFENTVDGVNTEGLVHAVDSDDFMSRLQSLEEV